MTLKNVMSVKLHAVNTGMCAEEVAQVMDQFGLTFLPVLAGGKPVGVVTAEDLARSVLACGLNGRSTLVPAFMNPHPLCLDEDTPIDEAALHMRKHLCSKLLVTRQDGTLAGVFTLADLAMAWNVEDVGEVLRRVSEANRSPYAKLAAAS